MYAEKYKVQIIAANVRSARFSKICEWEAQAQKMESMTASEASERNENTA